jgi:hypothetical protein
MGAREWLVACVLAVSATGCLGCNQTDLGRPCVLKKKNPDGGRPIEMTSEDVTAQGQDIISLGAQECDDFICVRDLGEPVPDAGASDAGTEPDAGTRFLTGYCTHACSGSGPGPCGPGDNPNPNRPYQCRPLLLDDNTLRALCFSNPGLCDDLFGPERSSNFCARGLAGTNP